MGDPLAELAPRLVWERFAALLAVPRPSGGEGRVAAELRAWAESRGLVVRQDAAGNLVIQAEASPGAEAAPPVALQGHLDMVCEKNREVAFDFERDAIRPVVRGEWLHADGTTLGADNGIGVAAALAVAVDPEATRPPLDLLFTVDEETGLTGAKRLDPSLLRARTLVNLDSEEEGVIFVGCAGGCDTILSLEPGRVPHEPGDRAFRVEVAGLRGGHSGMSIHENRGNAIKVLAHALLGAAHAGAAFHLAALRGGNARNAIPREAEAKVYLPPGEERRFTAEVERVAARFGEALRGIDDGLTVRVAPAEDGDRVLHPGARDRVLRLLVSLPHGVLAMSPAIPGLVETSTNLGVVATEDHRIVVTTNTRSSLAPALDAVLAQIRAQGQLAEAAVATKDGYPGWNPNLDSPVLAVVRDVYRGILGREPKVTAIHAGLECGLIGEKVPGMDMVSFGPRIEDVHSPGERVHVASVGRFYEALRGVLARLAERR